MTTTVTRNERQTLEGVVVKISDPKTLSVLNKRRVKHPIYQKVINQSKKYLVDVADSTKYNVGDKVTIMNTKPISKRKSWVVLADTKKKKK